MTSGRKTGGVDLDSIFAPYHSGWPQAALTGYQVGGTDINQRYAPLSTGSSAPATGYKKADADLNTIFAAYGSTGVQVATQPSNVSGSSAAGRPSGTVTSAAASCAGTKGSGSYTYEWFTSGCAATSPGSASTTFYATVDAQSTVNATAFCRISDGVSTVNTITIAVTLTNTSLVSFDFSITAGKAAFDPFVGYDEASSFGSISNQNIEPGYTIVGLYCDASSTTVLVIKGSSGPPPAGFISSVVTNGHTLNEASASYSTSGNDATWTWNVNAGYVQGSVYPSVAYL